MGVVLPEDSSGYGPLFVGTLGSVYGGVVSQYLPISNVLRKASERHPSLGSPAHLRYNEVYGARLAAAPANHLHHEALDALVDELDALHAPGDRHLLTHLMAEQQRDTERGDVAQEGHLQHVPERQDHRVARVDVAPQTVLWWQTGGGVREAPVMLCCNQAFQILYTAQN